MDKIKTYLLFHSSKSHLKAKEKSSNLFFDIVPSNSNLILIHVSECVVHRSCLPVKAPFIVLLSDNECVFIHYIPIDFACFFL